MFWIFTRCQVERSGTTKMSDTFKQPVIIPSYLTPPQSEGICVNTGDNIELTPNLQYMMSDQVDVADAAAVAGIPGVDHVDVLVQSAGTVGPNMPRCATRVKRLLNRTRLHTARYHAQNKRAHCGPGYRAKTFGHAGGN